MSKESTNHRTSRRHARRGTLRLSESDCAILRSLSDEAYDAVMAAARALHLRQRHPQKWGAR
jgi:hypothetical protein